MNDPFEFSERNPMPLAGGGKEADLVLWEGPAFTQWQGGGEEKKRRPGKRRNSNEGKSSLNESAGIAPVSNLEPEGLLPFQGTSGEKRWKKVFMKPGKGGIKSPTVRMTYS